MRFMTALPTVVALSAAHAIPAWGGLAAQELDPVNGSQITVTGALPDDITNLPEGPELEGIISSRRGREVDVTGPAGTNTVLVADGTEIRARGGFLNLNRAKLGPESLLNGLPVTVETVQWEGDLVASRIRFKANDLETAEMIRRGTEQQFAEQGERIDENAAATEALRGRVANIDQYNIKGTTNVYFDTAKWNLSPQGEYALCEVARQAEEMDNALLLVVGYTDSVGDLDYNQELSEKRAGRVVNFLQQNCAWQPWRMMTPTGMAESDPAADNETETGRAQNRRVSVNILVSKALDENG